jgi:hypothetical protein
LGVARDKQSALRHFVADRIEFAITAGSHAAGLRGNRFGMRVG